ncbi:glycosyl hydrolase family 18 protein [Coleofasciculus sp. E2-BRE-01]|uniref:glycosyl hydrolase family 18 protein n=1 Tax=Coleofasciculus sp. E2-BRE-01 TaxID=3069524 RepID=UPI0032F8ADE3
MGHLSDYPDVPDWKEKPEGYKTGEMVKYQGNIFQAAFWASKPGEGDPNKNGWRLYDELYDVTTSNTTEQINIIGYIPTWRKGEGFDYSNSEIYQYITHGIIAFIMFSESNLGEFDDKALSDVNLVISDVVTVGHAVGTKILIALGGATDYGFLYLMERIGNNPSDPLLKQTVQKVVDFVQSNDLDGVDLDLECWWDKNGDPGKDQGGRQKSEGPHPAGRGLTEFAKQLKQAMPDKIVSAAVFATSWYGNNYDPKLVDYLDWVAVMTYDLTGSWNDSPVGPQTALYKIREEEQKSYLEEQQGEWPGGGFVDNPILSVEDSLWYWTNPFFTNWQGEGQKLPRNKLAAGVPIYGYDFAYAKDPDALSGQVPPGYKSIRYKDLLSQFPDAHNAANAKIQVPGSTPRPNFRSNQPGSYPYQHNIYFETPATAVEKLNFLKSVGAQGIIIWELSNEVWQEGKSIVKALYQNSGNPEKENTIALPLTEEIRGEKPSVALNDYDVAVKVYVYYDPTPPSFDGPPRKPSTIRYCFGKVKGDTIKWGESKDFHIVNPDENPGRFLAYSVGINRNQIILVRWSNKDNSLWYDAREYSELLQDIPDLIETGISVIEVKRDAPNSPYDYGNNPCVDINNNGVIVDVHESDKTLWYRVGSRIPFAVPSQFAIEWSAESHQYDNGGAPSIAINDNKVVVEVHRSERLDDLSLWYHIGKVNGNRIEWGQSKQYAKEGIAPSVAINNNGLVIVVHHDLSGTLYYRIGRVQETKGEIEWTEDSSTRLFDGKDASVACNNKYALISYNPEKEKLGKIRDHLLSLPDSDIQWIEAQGENAYCYYLLDRSIAGNKAINTTKTIKVDEGTPYLNAVLMESIDSSAFPRGAVLKVKAPDGTEYSRETNSEELLAIESGSSLRSLVVKNPLAGHWQITLRVPEGVGFYFKFSTLPSQKIRETIEKTLPDAFDTEHGRLHKRQVNIGDNNLVQQCALIAPSVLLTFRREPIIRLQGSVVQQQIESLTGMTELDNVGNPRDGSELLWYQVVSSPIRVVFWNVQRMSGSQRNMARWDYVYNQHLQVWLVSQDAPDIVCLAEVTNRGEELATSLNNDPVLRQRGYVATFEPVDAVRGLGQGPCNFIVIRRVGIGEPVRVGRSTRRPMVQIRVTAPGRNRELNIGFVHVTANPRQSPEDIMDATNEIAPEIGSVVLGDMNFRANEPFGVLRQGLFVDYGASLQARDWRRITPPYNTFRGEGNRQDGFDNPYTLDYLWYQAGQIDTTIEQVTSYRPNPLNIDWGIVDHAPIAYTIEYIERNENA